MLAPGVRPAHTFEPYIAEKLRGQTALTPLLSEKKRKTPNGRSESEYRWKKNDYEG